MRRDGAPKYARIERDLRRSIGDGSLPLGSRVPSEEALRERYGVSRMTARQALERLAHAGLLVRRQGVGTFVAATRVERVASRLLGFHEDALAHGLNPSTTVLRKGEEQVGLQDGSLLSLHPDESVLCVERLRYGGDEPIGINRVVVVPPFVRALADLDYVSSFYDGVARALGVEVAEADTSIEAVAATDDVAALLQVGPGAPLLRTTRVTYLADGRLLGLTRTLYRGDRYYFALAIRRSEPAMPG